MSWETELNHCSNVEKAPTQLLCNGESDTSWGFSVPADKDALKWFKLLLLDEADISPEMSNSSQLQRTKQLLRDMNKDPVDVIGCYLRKIWNHAIESIRHSVGAELLQKSRFHVVITLPAIWPPYAQQRMRKAAKASGIADARPCGDTTLCFISEPEAAALATIKDLSKRSTVKVWFQKTVMFRSMRLQALRWETLWSSAMLGVVLWYVITEFVVADLSHSNRI